MAGKPRPIIIERKDFRVFLASRMGAGGMAKIAESLGISQQAVYALVSGESEPSDEVIAKLGLRLAYVLEVEPAQPEEPPAKPGKKR